eukprot:7390421-Prymnesium_polylepis.1
MDHSVYSCERQRPAVSRRDVSCSSSARCPLSVVECRAVVCRAACSSRPRALTTLTSVDGSASLVPHSRTCTEDCTL